MLQNELNNSNHPENADGRDRLNINELLRQVYSLIPTEGEVYFNEIKTAMTIGLNENSTMFETLADLCKKYKQELKELRLAQKNPEPVYINELEMIKSNWDISGRIDTLERIIPWLEAVPEVIKQ